MPDKLTDAEIIKAYELCFSEKGTSYTCAVCPYHQFGKLCKVNRNRDALDLINRQKAEIERLKEENKKQRLIVEAIDDNMFPLPFETDYDKAINKAKAEAYKEFAERVKIRFAGTISCSYGAIKQAVDNLLKEKVGGEK